MKKPVRFIVNPVKIYGEPWSPDSTRLGGTEESVVEWAKQLALRGRDVSVYYDGVIGEWDGVKYLPYEQYRGGDGVTINVKFSQFAPQEPTWYLTNETNARILDLSDFEGVILPSKWAFDNLGIQHDVIRILPHGFDPDYIFPDKKITNQCLYASSPDRGLSELEKHWPKVVEQVPNATLIVTYDGEIDLPNTICLGSVDFETMCELYRTSDFWLHPCLGGELFCMAAVKAQMSGAIPVYYPTMALKETVRHGIKCTHEDFADNLIAIMGDAYKQDWMRVKMKYDHFADWEASTDILESIIK